MNLQQYGQYLANKYHIPWDIFYNWINQESGWQVNPGVSSAGALGIAQIMPDTARGWGVNPMDPYAALSAAAQHLSEYYTKYGGSWPDALAAYNAGTGNVDKYGGVPPFAETQNYVSTILGGSAPNSSSDSSGSVPWYYELVPPLYYGKEAQNFANGHGGINGTVQYVALWAGVVALGFGGILWMIFSNDTVRNTAIDAGKAAALA